MVFGLPLKEAVLVAIPPLEGEAGLVAKCRTILYIATRSAMVFNPKEDLWNTSCAS